VSIFLDNRFAFSLGAEVAAREGLQVGQELSAGQAEALTGSDHFHCCLDAAYHYLGYRLRSEAELRGRLQRRGFDADTIEAVMARLKEQGMVDDVAFAQFWKENRESFSPRSRRLTRLELRRMGVVNDIAEQVVADLDDSESAYQAAQRKIRRWSLSDYQSFRRRLGEYLRRRGFDYEVINHTVERIWREGGNSSG
jgi:regulatory protein